ncbi:DUF3558 domain-containing protein [Streptomyces sp. NPDC059209]|uniref:DUF3558 domain-containing protein n=1 Tax=Streptomyces sp. NPDC059209 TaxID=3346769 RepID=UPI0036B5CE21
MQRSAPRPSRSRTRTRLRMLACAAVPVMIVAAGCSSDSGSGSDSDSGKDKPAASASKEAAKVAPAKFTSLPADPCKSIAAKTTADLVPKAKDKSGSAGKSSDITTRGSCSWNGLDDNGVKGSQYRWLDISFMRYDSDEGIGSGQDRAAEYYKKEVAKARATEGAKGTKATPAAGVGTEATAVTYSLSKTGETFGYATVVARSENVVITLTYNGAGYAGAKSPAASDLVKGATKAAKEAVAAVPAAK